MNTLVLNSDTENAAPVSPGNTSLRSRSEVVALVRAWKPGDVRKVIDYSRHADMRVPATIQNSGDQGIYQVRLAVIGYQGLVSLAPGSPPSFNVALFNRAAANLIKTLWATM